MTTKMLSRDQFTNARTFLFESARPLEKHLFMHLFGGLPVHQAVVELARYCNPDGGFGNALEPDMRINESSALATSIALQTMRLCNLDHDHELVQHALGFLMDTLEDDRRGWRIIPDSARTSDIDCAPWWSAPPDKSNQCAMFNPSAELLGYLIQWGVISNSNTSRGIATFVLDHLKQNTDPLESHELLCLMRLAQTPNLPDELAAIILPRLLNDAPIVAETDPKQWGGYGLMPLWLAPTPNHHAAEALGEDILNTNLDYVIEHQDAAGFWDPVWDWGPENRAAWEIARTDWQGVLTLQTLLTLRAYNRIEQPE